ncbi:MAG: hypothetical protein Q8O86_07195, partial [Dehalococcoidia bacterium]|nr:hypothetical protein [Dehalococcoidia bacterium]
RVEKGNIKRLGEKNRRRLTAVRWPDLKAMASAEPSAAPECISLEEFLNQVDRILRRGEAARVRERLLPIRDWVNWLHHAWLELEDRYGLPGGAGSLGMPK